MKALVVGAVGNIGPARPHQLGDHSDVVNGVERQMECYDLTATGALLVGYANHAFEDATYEGRVIVPSGQIAIGPISASLPSHAIS